MKRILLILFLATISSGIAQNTIELTFKDGSILKGFGRLKLDNEILYRASEDGEKVIYNQTTVKKIKITDKDGSTQVFEYKILDGASRLWAIKRLEPMEELGDKKARLYKETFGSSRHGAAAGAVASEGGEKYFISKSDSDVVIDLNIGNTYSGRFRKIASKFFSDCPDLLDKIKSKKHFKRYGIREVILYYNNNCSE